MNVKQILWSNFVHFTVSWFDLLLPGLSSGSLLTYSGCYSPCYCWCFHYLAPSSDNVPFLVAIVGRCNNYESHTSCVTCECQRDAVIVSCTLYYILIQSVPACSNALVILLNCRKQHRLLSQNRFKLNWLNITVTLLWPSCTLVRHSEQLQQYCWLLMNVWSVRHPCYVMIARVYIFYCCHFWA